MEANLTVGQPPLGEIYEAQDSAHACIAAEEYTQAIRCLARALSLIPASSDWFSDATSPSNSCDPIHALWTILKLERADCHLRIRQFEEALDDADNVLFTARRNIKAKQVKIEALFGLKQEREAIKIWTNVLLETSNAPEFELLTTRFPIAAVHVLHAVNQAKSREEPKRVETTAQKQTGVSQSPVAASGSTSVNNERRALSPISVEDTDSLSPFMNLGAAMLDQRASGPTNGLRAHHAVQREPVRTSASATLQRAVSPTREVMSDSDSDLESFFDPVFTELRDDRSPGAAPEEVRWAAYSTTVPRASARKNVSLENASFAAPTPSSPRARNSSGSESMIMVGSPSDLGESLVFVGAPATSPVPSGLSAAANVVERPSHTPTKRRVDKAELARKLQLANECIPQRDFVALLEHIDEVMEIAPTPSFLYERALCITAIPAFSITDKIAALSEYVARNPLDAEWIPHALYMMSAHYLDLHEYPDAARMRFLAEECELVRERRGMYPPIDSNGAFPKKAEVETAFRPPWLVLSFDEQRTCIENGSLACRTCPPNSQPVRLTSYVEHRTSRCPVPTTHADTNQPSKKKSGK